MAQGLTANMGRLTAINFGSFINANKVTPSLIKCLLGNMTFHVSKLWHGEINEKKGGGGKALKISEYFLLYFAIPAEILYNVCMTV